MPSSPKTSCCCVSIPLTSPASRRQPSTKENSGLGQRFWEILSGDLFGDLWPAAKPYVTLPSFPAEVIPHLDVAH